MAPMVRAVAGLAVVCSCMPESADAFFVGGGRPVVSSRDVSQRSRGGLSMAKHRQNKATKKHVKERPRKTRLSDKNHKPPEYSIEVMTNGNFPGAPPVWELVEEPAEGIDTKASVIEALATERWKVEYPVEAAEAAEAAAAAAAAAEPVATTVAPPEATPEMAEEVAVIADEVAEAVAEEVIGAAVEEVIAEAVAETENEGVPGEKEAGVTVTGEEVEPEAGSET